MTKSLKVQMGISIEPDLRQKIVERAKKENRSLSNLCCIYLEQGLK